MKNAKSTANQKLTNAKRARRDEFYTLIEDVRQEIDRYSTQLTGKSVLCNCDGPSSAFRQYFTENFQRLGLTRLVCTHIESEGLPATATIITSDAEKTVLLEGDGDFRSPECVRFLEEADVVVTNPPFSLWRDYISLLNKYSKKFIILGNQNVMSCRDVFPLFMEERMWLGYTVNKELDFIVPDNYPLKKTGYVDAQGRKHAKVGGISWFTNMVVSKREEAISLPSRYTPQAYPKYDNYDAIEVSRVANIPGNYKGIMGVPITYLNVHNPKQFEIVGLERYTAPKEALVEGRLTVDGKTKYARVLIRRAARKPLIVESPQVGSVKKAA